MRRLKFEVPPVLAIAKAKQIAKSMDLNDNEFKASWQWLKNFRARRGLVSLLHFGEGAEVDRNDQQLLHLIQNYCWV